MPPIYREGSNASRTRSYYEETLLSTAKFSGNFATHLIDKVEYFEIDLNNELKFIFQGIIIIKLTTATENVWKMANGIITEYNGKWQCIHIGICVLAFLQLLSGMLLKINHNASISLSPHFLQKSKRH